MAQQTAVEWLWRWQMDNEFASFKEGVDAYKRAKAMEKEQIIDSANDVLAQQDSTYYGTPNLGEQYYNETYGK